LLKQSPLLPPEGDRAFLFSVRQTDSRYHKNIAYRPSQDRVTGFSGSGADSGRLRLVLRAYSQRAQELVTELFAPYAQRWQIDLTSFRAVEEEGRQLPLKARNDLLHVDSFPTRPTNGNRILRVFTNISPTRPRVWLTGEAFGVQAKRMATSAGLADFAAQARSPWHHLRRRLTQMANSIGIPLRERSTYDRFMHKFHHYLKANRDFQENGPKWQCEFPPCSSWVVFTDAVLHAVLSGQFALEQTFIVPRAALLVPDKAPVHILEELCGTSLTV
jgi:3-deoxy-D-manno-oct-2-ulosonic acid (Kdo) hydroxylase